MKKRFLLIVPSLFLIGFGVWFYQNVMLFKASTTEDYFYENNSYKVDLEGEVVFPRRYEILEGTPLVDVLNYAGGLTANADVGLLDLTKLVTEDMKIVIPKKFVEDIPNLININYASYEMLLTVSGITEKRAASIILYREQNGLFVSLDELLNVKNIGPATLEKILPFLTV
jgi:competence protein ComEA